MSSDSNAIILAGASRTAIGNFNGALARVPATTLGAAALRAAVARSAIDPGRVDGVIMGNVLSAGLGQNPARQASIGAGVPPHVPAMGVSRVCGSGLQAVMLAAQSIRAGDASLMLAGGMENMTRAPHLLPDARAGYRFGNGTLIDSMLHDGLIDAYEKIPMGELTERAAKKYNLSRQEQDDFAIDSYHRARAADFSPEIVPVDAPAGKTTTLIQTDEGPAKLDEAKLRKLPPVFAKDGTITAGNASGINDGAAALVVASAEAAATMNFTPQAKVLAFTIAAGPPEWFALAPILAITKLLTRIDRTVPQIDLFEINEAFAVVPLAAMRELSIPRDRLNIHGGAIALGHPIGASGARILVTLIHNLQKRGGGVGIATLCIGGGEAVALAIEV